MIMPDPDGGLTNVSLLVQTNVPVIFRVFTTAPTLSPGDTFVWKSTSGDAADDLYSGEYTFSSANYNAGLDRWSIYSTTIGTEYRTGS
jgi:hypothetical protein